MEELSQQLPAFCSSRVLVLGCGNILFGDDGFGCAVADYVENHCEVPADVCVLDVGTGVRKLLFTLCLSETRPQRIVVVDAFDCGRRPGEIFELDPSAIPVVKLDDFSLHHVPTSNLLRDLQEHCCVEVRVLACQTAPLPAEVSPGLSPEVAEAVPRAAEILIRDYFPLSEPAAAVMQR
jgi:coenzyme F420 hydrogenase subunit delta